MRRGQRALPLLVGLAVATAGVVNLVSAVTPSARWDGVLPRLEPVGDVAAFHALAVPTSAIVVATGLALAKRRRRAWQTAVLLLPILALIDVLKGFDLEEASLSLALALVLLWRREDFSVRHPPLSMRSAAWRVAVLGLGAAAVASVAAVAAADPDVGTPQLVRAAAGLLVGSPGPIEFGAALAWVPAAVAATAASALLACGYVVFRPLAAPGALPDARVRRAAARLVRRHGTDTLAYFQLRRDKHYLFSADGRALVAYRVENRALIVSGDPVGEPEACPALVQQLRSFADTRGLSLGVLGASERLLPLWRAAGLRALYLGDEAIVETPAFTLAGRSIRKVRQSVHRLERAGYSVELVHVEEVGDDVLDELRSISQAWLGGATERGFSMAMDSLNGEHQPDSVVVVARGSDGAARAFLQLVPTFGRAAMSLSMMRRRPDTPNGLTEFLVVRTIELLRERDITELSLNFAAFARFCHAPRNPGERLLGRLVAVANPFFQIESLYRFNAKFSPRWEPRYLLCEHTLALPRVGLACLRLEGQLPKPRVPIRPTPASG